ncbi:MAG: GGDEF domain-containing protein [Alphaproteobacteria bacterium]|nr:GGDEF domain-containing protein [Alphaproteobacteria bacterium]NCQ87420.1 GGDEF domain-containing protein [Alphaproteobacteria bacterium]NCT06291.1 GGDEF domain-containing protein [Alphaproteobacteria bacterium]
MQTDYSHNILSSTISEQTIFSALPRNDQSARALLEQAKKIIRMQASRIEELNRIATTDELTNINNRRGFIQTFERELDRAGREKKGGMKRLKGGLLIMIDLDNFKGINDTHGHACGDAALKLVAQTLKMDIRKMDVAGRLGGDEFVVLFTNTTKKESMDRVQRLIRTLNNLSFIWEGHEIPVRASIGVREYHPGDKTGRIFSAADKALYSDKARNSGPYEREVSHA